MASRRLRSSIETSSWHPQDTKADGRNILNPAPRLIQDPSDQEKQLSSPALSPTPASSTTPSQSQSQPGLRRTRSWKNLTKAVSHLIISRPSMTSSRTTLSPSSSSSSPLSSSSSPCTSASSNTRHPSKGSAPPSSWSGIPIVRSQSNGNTDTTTHELSPSPLPPSLSRSMSSRGSDGRNNNLRGPPPSSWTQPSGSLSPSPGSGSCCRPHIGTDSSSSLRDEYRTSTELPGTETRFESGAGSGSGSENDVPLPVPVPSRRKTKRGSSSKEHSTSSLHRNSTYNSDKVESPSRLRSSVSLSRLPLSSTPAPSSRIESSPSSHSRHPRTSDIGISRQRHDKKSSTNLGGSSSHRIERGWTGEWNMESIGDVIQALRGLK